LPMTHLHRLNKPLGLRTSLDGERNVNNWCQDSGKLGHAQIKTRQGSGHKTNPTFWSVLQEHLVSNVLCQPFSLLPRILSLINSWAQIPLILQGSDLVPHTIFKCLGAQSLSYMHNGLYKQALSNAASISQFRLNQMFGNIWFRAGNLTRLQVLWRCHMFCFFHNPPQNWFQGTFLCWFKCQGGKNML
jgi:hypothetical protein